MTKATTERTPAGNEILAELAVIRVMLQDLVAEKSVKEWYTTTEVAALVGRAEYTVREWCRLGRVVASKKAYNRGAHSEWIISHGELQKLRNGVLRPLSRI